MSIHSQHDTALSFLIHRFYVSPLEPNTRFFSSERSGCSSCLLSASSLEVLQIYLWPRQKRRYAKYQECKMWSLDLLSEGWVFYTAYFKHGKYIKQICQPYLLWIMWLLTRWPAASAAIRDSSPAITVPHTIRASCRAFSPGLSLHAPWTPSICSQGQTQQDSTFLSRQQLPTQSTKTRATRPPTPGTRVWAKLRETEEGREARRAAVHGAAESDTPEQRSRSNSARTEPGSTGRAAVFSKSASQRLVDTLQWTEHPWPG